MRWTRLACTLALLLAAVFLLPRLDPRPPELHMVDESGRDTLCTLSFARVHEPERARLTWNALLTDFAYAAADAGVGGCAVLLALAAFVALLLGMWCGGIRCGLRRLLVTAALGVPVLVGLTYLSCFLPGRTIRLGPEAQGYVLASLHAQTNRSTGFLSPRDLWLWHYARGFRVLNVSDKDRIDGAEEAIAYGRDQAKHSPMLVLAGEEWQGGPDLVLVNVRRLQETGRSAREVMEEVAREEGCAFVAHPWSKLDRPLEEVLREGASGAELVNGVIHGGAEVLEATSRAGKTVLGVLDYKFGPHINAVTLVPEALAQTPEGVVQAIRGRRTRILYAVPGGPVSGTTFDAGMLETTGAWSGGRTLLETPLARRGAWFGTLALVVIVWSIATRRTRGRRLGVRGARFLLLGSAILLLATPAALSWQVRARFGTLPIPTVLLIAAVLALPLLAATASLAQWEEEAQASP